LTVTDAAGLSTTQEVRLYPDCRALAPVLKYLGRDAFGAVRWQLTGDSARTYQVEGSTNLVDWSEMITVQPVAGAAEFGDLTAGDFRFRFYRAVLAP